MIDGIISALSVLKDTPFPTIIGVAGILFILLAFVARIGGTSVFTSSQRIGALIIGFLLLMIGIFLSVYNPPSTSSPDEQSSSVLLFELNPLKHPSRILVSECKRRSKQLQVVPEALFKSYSGLTRVAFLANSIWLVNWFG